MRTMDWGRWTWAWSAAALIVCVGAALLLPGCRIGGERSVSAENDRLRLLTNQQADEIQALKAEQAELRVKLVEASRATQPTLTPDALVALPRVTALEVDGLSGFDPIDLAKPATKVIVSFKTLDGRGRFVQGVGSATIEAQLLGDQVGSPDSAIKIAGAALTPIQVRDAYRSSFTGTHYTVELPLADPIDRSKGNPQTLVVRVEFKDALTGETVRGERVFTPAGAKAKRADPSPPR